MASADVIAPLALSVVKDIRSASFENRAVEADRQRRLAEVRAQMQAREAQRRTDLKRAQASQRAHFGGQGLTSSGGSAAAILNGLVAESRRQSQQDQRNAALGINDINSAADINRRRNLLDAGFSVADRVLNARTAGGGTILSNSLKLLG